MSARYIERLRRVRGEYQAARQAIKYVNENWTRDDMSAEIEGVTPVDFTRAADQLEATYILRLFAEFEGILEHHLAANHSRIAVHRDRKFDWLVHQVLRAETLTVDPALRANIGRVREYRNAFVHSGTAPVATFTFRNVLSWLNTFLDKLPDPLT